jgi:hypothetical protein
MILTYDGNFDVAIHMRFDFCLFGTYRALVDDESHGVYVTPRFTLPYRRCSFAPPPPSAFCGISNTTEA